jgi:hypothetical protein
MIPARGQRWSSLDSFRGEIKTDLTVREAEGARVVAMDRSDAKRDVWDKLQVTAVSTAAVAVPVALALIGYEFNSAIKDKDVRVKTVEIAINVLIQDPQTIKTPHLRDWAINVVDRYSGIQLEKAATEELKGTRLPWRLL